MKTNFLLIIENRALDLQCFMTCKDCFYPKIYLFHLKIIYFPQFKPKKCIFWLRANRLLENNNFQKGRRDLFFKKMYTHEIHQILTSKLRISVYSRSSILSFGEVICKFQLPLLVLYTPDTWPDTTRLAFYLYGTDNWTDTTPISLGTDSWPDTNQISLVPGIF